MYYEDDMLCDDIYDVYDDYIDYYSRRGGESIYDDIYDDENAYDTDD